MQETPKKQGVQPAIVLHSLHSFLHFGMGFLHCFLQPSVRPSFGHAPTESQTRDSGRDPVLKLAT